MPEMEYNESWNHDHPCLSSAPVLITMASTDIVTRSNDHVASNFIPTFPASVDAYPETSNSSYLSTSNGSSSNFPQNQVPNWPFYTQETICPILDHRRVAFKRKGPTIPLIADRTSAAVYPQVGSYVNHPSTAGLEPNIPIPECRPFNTISMPPSHRIENNIAGEGPQRNVRSRQSEAFPSHSNPAWLCASRDTPYPLYPSCNTYDPRMREQWNYFPSTPQGWLPPSDAGSSNQMFSQHIVRGNNNGGSTATNSAYLSQNQNRNLCVPLSALQSPSIQSLVPTQNVHNHFGIPYAISSNYPVTDTSAASVVGVLVGMEAAASSRYLRPPPIMGHIRHGGSRNTRDVHQRSHLMLSGHNNARSRWAPEGALMTNWLAFYNNSVNLHDQHREMRMDIDNMSYEELLALGERIGSVSTGLPEETASKCVVETVVLSSCATENEGKCTICLEEFRDEEKLGRLSCGHDFHVCCITQWLQMKNVCPVCREPALSDNSKEH